MTKGERIKQLRKSRGMSQPELAKLLSTTKQTIYKYETDAVTNIPSDKVEILASVFGTTPSYILGWDEQKNQEASAATENLSDIKSKFIESVMEMTDEQVILLQAVVDQVLRENGLQ